jgi:ribosomal protein S18 acetylase RimI-like enzyme
MAGTDKPAVMIILQNTPQFTPSDVAVAGELIDIYLEDPVNSGYFILVAEVNTTILGYICYGPTPLTEGTWDVYWIAVDSKEQGKGIGKALLTSAESKIKESNGRLVLIETSSLPGYENTRRFYISQGYEIISRIPDFYTPGDDKITFLKRMK